MRAPNLVAICALSAICACTSEVSENGDVFIATRGGQSYKLALVTVSAFSETALRKAAAGQVARARPLLAGGASYDSLQKKVIAAGNRLAPFADAAGSAAGWQRWKLAYDLPDYPGTGDRSRWDGWRRAYTDSLHLASAQRELESKARRILSAAGLLESISLSGTSAKTDADGKFSLNLSSGTRYALHATASRAVFDRTEKYEWLVWLTPTKDGARATLANDWA